MARLEYSAALEAVMQLVTQANRYIEATAPWKLAKEEGRRTRLHTVLYMLAEVVRIVAITLSPFMPAVSSAIWQQLGCGAAPRRLRDASQWGLIDAGQPIGAHPVLFPKTESR
jgi:methionyl-tRNA synthetase